MSSDSGQTGEAEPPPSPSLSLPQKAAPHLGGWDFACLYGCLYLPISSHTYKSEAKHASTHFLCITVKI